jgi:hypothetical protein
VIGSHSARTEPLGERIGHGGMTTGVYGKWCGRRYDCTRGRCITVNQIYWLEWRCPRCQSHNPDYVVAVLSSMVSLTLKRAQLSVRL